MEVEIREFYDLRDPQCPMLVGRWGFRNGRLVFEKDERAVSVERRVWVPIDGLEYYRDSVERETKKSAKA